MEWSDSQGLSRDNGGASSTVGGGGNSPEFYEKLKQLPEWLKEARRKALEKEDKR